jgi:hypothetical protein
LGFKSLTPQLAVSILRAQGGILAEHKHDEISIAHMSMIQGIITRLETNAFTLKALAMTLATAVLAFSGSVKNPSWVYPMAGCFPVVIFWIMDAKYLRLGRLFRRLFNAVRLGKVDTPFEMDIKPYMKNEQSVLRIAFSWSVFWFYFSIIVAFIVVSFYFLKKGG